MNWKGSERKQLWFVLWHYPGICLEGLRKIIKALSQDSLSADRDLNLGPPKYEAEVLTTQLCSLVHGCHVAGKELQNKIK
jgi:hypothetical protein